MKPLEGVTILEFSTMVTAAFAAMMMAEQGARVIKVEPLVGGDPMRYGGSNKGGISALFANVNRGKESIRVDLKSDEGQRLIREMIERVDIVIHNFRPGVMDKLNLGSEDLRKINPKLIYMAISGFGNVGALRDAPAYDPIIQAMTGFTATQSKPDAPEFVNNLMCDKITAYTACQAVTAALYAREKTGGGQHIDLSMLDAGLFFIFPDGFMHHTLLDDDADQQPPLSKLLYRLWLTKDGGLTMSPSTQAQQMRLIEAVGCTNLLDDERFSTPRKRIENQSVFWRLIRESFLNFTTDEILERLQEYDVPAAKLHSYEEVLNHPQFASTGTITEIDHPLMGNMRLVKSPARFGGDRLEPARNSPAHGEHTREVLQSFGIADDQLKTWIGQGIVS